jgi:hypothetical protein
MLNLCQCAGFFRQLSFRSCEVLGSKYSEYCKNEHVFNLLLYQLSRQSDQLSSDVDKIA